MGRYDYRAFLVEFWNKENDTLDYETVYATNSDKALLECIRNHKGQDNVVVSIESSY